MFMTYEDKKPRLGPGCYVAPTAVVIGDVVLGPQSSIWFNTVVRGDVNSIRIGARTNVQDLSMLHVTTKRFPLKIGDDVTIGHGAVIHGCTLEGRTLVGMGATILDGAVIGADSIVAAGALVPEGAVFPPRSMLMGIPARRVRETTDEELERVMAGGAEYVKHATQYNSGAAVDTDPDGA